MKKTHAMLMSLALLIPAAALAYPNGTPMYATDTGPFCASCHSAAKTEYIPELPPDVAEKETPEFKHYGLIRSNLPISPYNELTAGQKENIIKTAKLIDSNSTVSLSAPSKVKTGEPIKVTVKARGGNGPSICVMLVDRALRFQSRPVSADGWSIVNEPQIKGQDGTVQSTWLEKRLKGLKSNLNFITAFDQRFDPEKNIYPATEVTYTLKAPSVKGTYTLAAAFLYGTENTEKAGFFQRPSGRILFSDEMKIEVE
ncbi:MAG: hypothetical protein HZB83_04500 [Deltaproteobacteria bacterium]|nr:hypothetical protein [Deltaproteobacteria bacterium]